MLCYHGVSREWPAAMAIDPERLERQIALLLERGWVPATFTRAILDPPAARTLAVTFDDACRSVRERGLPILERLALPATVFAPSCHIGAGEPMSWSGVEHWLKTRYRDELAPMDWDELASLRAAAWEVGSHTRTHPRLTELDPARLAEELAGSREEIEEGLGAPCTSLAYPYGDCDARVARAARAAGYAVAGALLPHPLGRPRRWMYPRVMVCREDSDARFIRQTRATMRALQGSRMWPAVARGVQGMRVLRHQARP